MNKITTAQIQLVPALSHIDEMRVLIYLYIYKDTYSDQILLTHHFPPQIDNTILYYECHMISILWVHKVSRCNLFFSNCCCV